MKVVWTLEAEKSFLAIIDYLLNRWTATEAGVFIDLVEATIDKITDHPEMFKPSQYDPESREAFLTKHTTMFYRIIENTIEIEFFWGNFQNPKRLEKRFNTPS